MSIMLLPLILLLSVNVAAQTSINSNTVNTGKIVIDGIDVSASSSLQGSGKVKTKSVVITEDFVALKSFGSFDLIIHQGERRIELEGDDSLIDLVRFKVDRQQLLISMPENYRTAIPLTLTISNPAWQAIDVSGAGSVTLHKLRGEHLRLDFSGAIEVNGTGQVKSLSILTQGAGDIDVRGLIADTVKVQSSGAGDIQLTARKRLDIKAFGTGDIVYYGAPAEINKNLTGVSDVKAGE